LAADGFLELGWRFCGKLSALGPSGLANGDGQVSGLERDRQRGFSC
jgi:hypothetical protein